MKRIILALAFLGTLGVHAQTPEERGLEIAKAAEQADLGFGSSIVDLKMTLKNKNGQTSERHLTTKTLELTEGKMFHTITYGKGLMGSHSSQLNKEERWKLVHYIRTAFMKEAVVQDTNVAVVDIIEEVITEVVEEAPVVEEHGH